MMKILMTIGALCVAAQAGAAEFRMPAFETTKLPNGLTVYLMERHEAPIIAMRAVVKAGSVNDGAQAGLASLTAEATMLGTSKRNKAAIDRAFDFRGARVTASGSSEQVLIDADFARDDASELMPLLAEMVTTPSFDAAELAKLQKRRLIGLAQAKEAPRNVVRSYYNSMLFGTAPYATPGSGTVASVTALRQQDVKSFHQRYYRPDNAAIVVVGDFKTAEMKQRITSLFAGWSASGPAPQPQDNGKVQADKARVWLVNKPDAIETTFMIGGRGIARNDPDYVPLQVLNTVMGGRFTSWLNDELRVNSGLTYGARSEFATYSQTGIFGISSFTASKNTKPALELALKTYNRLWDKGIDAATLESAKAYVKGQYPPRFETSSQLAALLGDMFVSNVGREQIDNFMRDVDALTPARAKALAERHFPRNNLQMVLIGKADEIRPIAAAYGEVTELEISADGFQPVKK